MWIILLLVVVVCIAIILVKDINPQVKAIAKNILIVMGVLAVIFAAVLLFTQQRILGGHQGRMIDVPATPK